MRYPISTAHSTSIDTLSVNPITGTVRVRFQSYRTDRPYVFKVPRAAILSLIWDSNRSLLGGGYLSLGQWINRHCRA